MDLQLVKQRAFEHLGKRKAHRHREVGFIYHHGVRVANFVVNLRRLVLPEDGSKDEILQAAAYFHDVAKGIEPHAKYGAVLVRELLQDICTRDEIEEIADLIACHAQRKKRSYNVFEMLLQDADLLDHFGTIDIWMSFCYCAIADKNIDYSIEFYDTEFKEMAAKNRSLLNFEVSERIFDEKLAFEDSFMQRLIIENRGDIVSFDKE